MNKCNHKWQGDCRGVHCLLCGLSLSPSQYQAMIAADIKTDDKPAEKPKRGRKK